MKYTIKDIAKFSGVSTATVSKVLNNKDEKISERTRQKVLEVSKKYNYSLNRVASSMVTRKTKTIGLILPDISNPFFPEMARGVEDKSNELDYNIIICNTDDDIKKEKKYIKTLLEKMVDGIIIVPSAGGESASNFSKLNLPIVIVDRDVDSSKIKGKVLVNNFKGAYEGTKYLIDKGYKKIAFISGNLSNTNALERFKGYKKALKDKNIGYDEKYFYEGEFRKEWGKKAIDKMINSGLDFDCIFSSDDMIAIGAMKELKNRGYNIPKDIGVLGFDDIYMAKLMEPELSSIKQPMYEMGHAAADMIINIINDIELKEKEITFKTELQIRESI
ncbi:LacI family DNA-binding transcriptional regulator [Clostridium sp. D2Q-11]|uniref:LacI family DNA-binding transcriptional regulator n=1 Tax=Anaeromonas frigoriresistens TaxID=2683708 RepID=A0A942UTB1_9FIRM|nr:LacI family DNA-binding transcriptional regulator [Anaeromonas frigoriresistens]MBS4538844.1 LacI family DNA-binding transcriptional regulator [Anaeromonas frigoriresistens]